MAVLAYQIPISTDGRAFLAFAPEGSRGWCSVLAGPVEASTMVRIGPHHPEGVATVPPVEVLPLEIREVRVVGIRGGVRSATLRAIPFSRIEAAVNIPEHRVFLNGAVLDSSTFHDWQPPPGYGPQGTPDPYETLVVGLAPPPVNPKLDVPAVSRKPNSFFVQVADVFLRLAATSDRPARDIAEANGVAPSMVHNWVRESKARGLLLLPPNSATAD